jgi:hypothetical protein
MLSSGLSAVLPLESVLESLPGFPLGLPVSLEPDSALEPPVSPFAATGARSASAEFSLLALSPDPDEQPANATATAKAAESIHPRAALCLPADDRFSAITVLRMPAPPFSLSLHTAGETCRAAASHTSASPIPSRSRRFISMTEKARQKLQRSAAGITIENKPARRHIPAARAFEAF